jgi:transcriptional regulator with PAS, ATPase and Fis domain
VLITGESGTGKELLSCFLHRHSRRAQGPYIRVNCAALSESLLESELFGHERGAFTGAYLQRKGKFERAHGGTLLLDEISETSARLQAQLLRVLEQQDFERVGGSESVQVNVRVISTSNRDLAAEVEKGRFRRDLYYRLGGMHLVVPPLRERTEDITPLVWHFVNLHAPEVQRTIEEIDPSLLQALCRCPWPGNVRQLRNTIRTALILGEGETLSLCDVPNLAPQLEAPRAASLAPTTLSLQELEKQAILEALRRTQSHQVRAAKLLGITDRTLREKLRRYRQEGQGEGAPTACDDAAAAGQTPPETDEALVHLVGEGTWLGQRQ